MQVNNSQPSFKALSFTPRAMKAMSERMPSGRFAAIEGHYEKMYENSPLNIIVDTVAEGAIRLSAKIKEINKTKYSAFNDYFEEGLFSSTFCSPEKFLKKLCNDIDQKEIKLTGKLSRTDKGV